MPAGGAPRTDVALAVAIRDRRCLVARRPEASHAGGGWEFPGGKLDSGEEPQTAARRELAEETGLEGGRLEPLLVLVHDYPDVAVRLHCFIVADPEGEVSTDDGREHRWVTGAELAGLAMPEANGPIVRALRWRL